MVKIASELSILEPIYWGKFFVPNLWQKWYVPEKILGCLYIATQEFTWKKKWIFKQSAAPTLATLAGAANGLRPLAVRGLAGIRISIKETII